MPLLLSHFLGLLFLRWTLFFCANSFRMWIFNFFSPWIFLFALEVGVMRFLKIHNFAVEILNLCFLWIPCLWANKFCDLEPPCFLVLEKGWLLYSWGALDEKLSSLICCFVGFVLNVVYRDDFSKRHFLSCCCCFYLNLCWILLLFFCNLRLCTLRFS